MVIAAMSSTRFAVAQDATESDRHANTRRLIELTGDAETANRFLDMAEGSLPPDRRNEFRKLREAGFVASLMDGMLPIYEKYFNDEEVMALIKFHESAIGRKFHSLQPEMVKDVVASSQKAVMEAMQRVQRTAFERQSSYYKAVEMAEKGQVEAAVSAFRDAIELDPENADLQYGLGDALHDLSQDEGALAAYVKATQLGPLKASTHPKLNAALRAADANWHDACGVTALMLAATVGDNEAARALLAKSANAGAKNNFGFTALITASFFGHSDVVDTLLAGGADVGSRGPDGATALIQAATWGHERVVRALLKAGADANAKDNDGRTALILAERGGHTKIVELLKEAAKVSEKQSQTKT
jgi:tetratricopeptide (TPR) repeat protein